MSKELRTREIAFLQRQIKFSRKAGIPYSALSHQLTKLLRGVN